MPETPTKKAHRSGRHCQQCSSRGAGIFCDLVEHQLEYLDRAKIDNFYKKGQVLFYEGAPLTGVFCVASGKIKLYKTGEDGKELILRIASAGDLLGTHALFTDKLHDLTATVIEDAELCHFGDSVLEDLIDRDRPLAKKFIQSLGEEISQTQDRMISLLNQNVRQRFVGLLLELCQRHGKTRSKGMIIDVRLSRSEIAALIGTAPETVIRLISEFKSDGLLDSEGKNLIVLDLDRLREID